MSNSNKSQIYHITAKVITTQVYNGVKRKRTLIYHWHNAVEYVRN